MSKHTEERTGVVTRIEQGFLPGSFRYYATAGDDEVIMVVRRDQVPDLGSAITFTVTRGNDD